MGDRQRGGGKEPLTEREREVLKALARAVVSEAGLQEDPERTAKREDLNRQMDTLKHMTTLSGATLVAVAVVYNSLNLGGHGHGSSVIGASLVFVGFAFVAALLCLYAMNYYAGVQPNVPTRVLDRRIRLGAYGVTISGAALLSGILGLFAAILLR